MLKNTHNHWKKARCRYLGNTPCVLLIEGESTGNSWPGSIDDANGNMFSWWCMLGNYWFERAFYLYPAVIRVGNNIIMNTCLIKYSWCSMIICFLLWGSWREFHVTRDWPFLISRDTWYRKVISRDLWSAKLHVECDGTILFPVTCDLMSYFLW